VLFVVVSCPSLGLVSLVLFGLRRFSSCALPLLGHFGSPSRLASNLSWQVKSGEEFVVRVYLGVRIGSLEI
jgi:hypothetical protein